ncbi:MAG: hypothetical protein ABIK82_17360 [Pseudomonadota bacterium]
MQTHAVPVETTVHARQRARERGIPPLVIDWLLKFGETEWDHHGAQVKFFTRKSRRRIDQAVGTQITRRMHEFLDSYAVVTLDGALITCGHRYKRIHRQ